MNVDAVLMNEGKMDEHLAEMHGICLQCGAIDYHRIEPDAVNYVCPECGKRGVMGMEEAVSNKFVIPSKDKYPMLSKYKRS